MAVFFNYTLTVLMTLVALMELVQVVSRYIFKVPIMGLEELLVYPAIWLYFIGSANASREDTQIKANVLDVFLKSKRSILIIRIIADVLSVLVSLWLAWWAWLYFLYALRVWKDSPTLYVPMFYAESFVFLGVAAMTIYGVIYLVKNIKLLPTTQN
jgi:TRAP-type C4-dicarboxylate transport system permease small subunit